MDTPRLIRLLCVVLVVGVVGAAVANIFLALEVLAKVPVVPDEAPLVDRLLANGSYAQALRPLVMASAVLAAIAFLTAVLIGMAIRPLVLQVPVRDTMAALLAVGGILCVSGQLVYLAVIDNAALLFYCECPDKLPELIAQSKSTDLGSGIQLWMNAGGLAAIAGGVALAGALARGSAALSSVSYVVALMLGLVVILYALGQRTTADALLGLTAAFGVTTWAILLARWTTTSRDRPGPPDSLRTA